MIVQGIKCPKCHKEVYSRTRHDWRTCPCGLVFVDGGRSYLRVGFAKEQGKYDLGDIEMVDIEVKENTNEKS